MDKKVPSPALENFIREMFGVDKDPIDTPKMEIYKHVGWKPAHPNQEPPF